MTLANNWQMFALGSAFFAGLTALFAKLGVSGINSNLATLIRTVIILFFIFCVVSLRNEWQRMGTVDAKTWIFLTLSALTTGLSWLCYYRALQLGPVSKVASVDKLSLAFAFLLGVLVLAEKVTWQIILGVCLIIGGSILIMI